MQIHLWQKHKQNKQGKERTFIKHIKLKDTDLPVDQLAKIWSAFKCCQTAASRPASHALTYTPVYSWYGLRSHLDKSSS